jgi:hypothetical protein
MSFWLRPFLEHLNYPRRGEFETRKKSLCDRKTIDVLQHSITDSFAIFFFPALFYELSTFGARIHHWMARDQNDYNFLMHDARLDEKSLRRIFTGIELIVFKLFVLSTEGLSSRYDFESEKTKVRFGKLVRARVLDEAFRDVFDEVLFTRNAFSHSFLDVGEIAYKTKPLHDCFGVSGVGRVHLNHDQFDNPNDTGVFLFDTKRLTDHLVDRFRAVQFKQIDQEKLFKLCDRLLRERKMLP